LKSCEIQTALAPQHELAVKHNVSVEFRDGCQHFREVAAEYPILPRLQDHPACGAQGDASEAVNFGSKIHPVRARNVRTPVDLPVRPPTVPSMIHRWR
jgi:hypothetical protein